MSTSECFLCKPDPKLVIEAAADTFAMVGYGPLTKTYSLIASREHDRSLADMAVREPTALEQVEDMRARMESAFGPLLFTEHGRVPICRDDGDDHEQHCFHAHGLFYRTDARIEETASSYYGCKEVFASLSEALSVASNYGQYALISPERERVLILSQPLNVPRQLMRTLVAIAEGVPGLADWRAQPRNDAALSMAANLRRGLAP